MLIDSGNLNLDVKPEGLCGLHANIHVYTENAHEQQFPTNKEIKELQDKELSSTVLQLGNLNTLDKS